MLKKTPASDAEKLNTLGGNSKKKCRGYAELEEKLSTREKHNQPHKKTMHHTLHSQTTQKKTKPTHDHPLTHTHGERRGTKTKTLTFFKNNLI